jgi:hypothetical protein
MGWSFLAGSIRLDRIEKLKYGDTVKIRIQKRAEVTGGLPARDMADHIPGRVQPEGFSIPIDYTIEGDLTETITVGKSVKVIRETRNGVKALGIFHTSPVTEVTDRTFRTLNSVYDFEYLPE